MNLLIGGTGFVGTALSQVLAVERGESVVSLSRRGTGSTPGVAYQQFDIQHNVLPANLLAKTQYAFILSGQKGNDFNPVVELEAHKRLFQSLANASAKVFLASSILVYGNSKKKFTENSICQPIDPYEAFKLNCENAARAVIPPDRLVVFRIATLYGPNKLDGFVARALSATEMDPLILAGAGQIERDFLYIDDAVNGMLAVRDAPGSCGIVNISRGDSITLLNITRELENVLDRPIPYKITTEAGSGPVCLRTNNHRLRTEFNFTSFTALATGLERTVAAYQAVGGKA